MTKQIVKAFVVQKTSAKRIQMLRQKAEFCQGAYLLRREQK